MRFVAFKVPDDWKAEAEELAKVEGVSMADILRRWLRLGKARG
jgi:hypothetical protein